MRTTMRELGYVLTSLVVLTAGCSAAETPFEVLVPTVDHGQPRTIVVRIAPDSVVLQKAWTLQLTATVLADGRVDSGSRIVWSVGDTSIVGLSNAGLLLARRVGATTVSASVGSVASTASVRVIDTVTVVTPPPGS
jgi:Bacterial Ig-like domain (group 2)